MSVTMEFNLPYSIVIEGNFHVVSDGIDFGVNLTNIKVDKPNFPGMDNIENVYIIDDDTNIIWYTRVIASYDPPHSELGHSDPTISFKIRDVALSLANTLIMGARIACGEHVKDYLYHHKRISPIQYNVTEVPGQNDWFGVSDSLMGGITNVRPTKTADEISSFETLLSSGAVPTVSVQLYSDARRYLVQRNYRMAMANLAMSFELGLADDLSRVAVYLADAGLEAEILEGTIYDLGSKFATRTLGTSFERSSYWGSRFTETFDWLRIVRNKVLHRGSLVVSRSSVTKDFTDQQTIGQFFADRDWLKKEIDDAVSRVTSGLPAKP